MEYANSETQADEEAKAAGDHPVWRGVLRDIDEMEKLMDNLFNFELAAHAGAHTPVSVLSHHTRLKGDGVEKCKRQQSCDST